ncbi:hypothetical protein DQJ97_24180 [Salmonella enterica subsp. enterica serovar Poona]|nr:hypothetical protein [Salmonella enterica subsp. enterica serovar Poona]ECF6834844.1 hypothetical protein [Salmonella enterica subsp. enterica]EDV2697125.1 hypothetical protein [Salmonella enterica subsp. enterica serovar Poona]EGI6283810.1 hypothetical protein [Salmonella enterica subsp. enterica serovar Telhashomer]
MRKKRYLLSMLGIASVVVPCMSMATTLESNETLPTVGHKPTLEMGLRINGGPNLISMDSDGKIHLSPLAPEIKVGDFIEFHGIYSDIDGDIESKTYYLGNTMELLSECPGMKDKTLNSEFYGRKRSDSQWSHSYTLTNDEIGCQIVYLKPYAESNDVQTTSTGATYTPTPKKGNNTTSTSGIKLGIVK